ncbi:MAG: ABC-F family ATP-binding cassette domain-containing protein [Bacillaceae bacterium]|nr:ABC-F family ATP-binding cassette domain-containing protein [Bacillaceae bacterium]
MILLQAVNISKSFQGEPILDRVSLQVRKGERVGLVGVNGAGKSTLLKIITGMMSADSGEIIKQKETTVGYLAQNTGLNSRTTIWEEMMQVFAPLKKMEHQLRELEAKMGDPEIIGNESAYQQLLDEYSRLSESFKEQGGYRYEADTRNILHGLRFYEADYDRQIETLSGGQKTRLALARLLLQKPDVLVLDEPTNHLDMDTLNWLEQYLQNYEGGILVVSHDRYFLDQLVNVVYEIERTKAVRYTGNYSRFLQEKAQRLDQQVREYEKQQEEIKRMEDFIQKNIARASTTKRAQSRRKALEKMDRIDKPVVYNKKASFSFEIEKKSGHDVLVVSDLSVGYPEHPLLNHIDFKVTREDRVALIGPNGSGKSTLLKTLVGQIRPLDGNIQWGSSVSVGYYDQEQRNLHPEKTVLQELWDDYPDMLERDVRTVLGNFLFSGDDVKKKVSHLSGGEKARLSLAKLMLQKANVLILDEPTNHLDVYSREVLENALEHYPGTLIFVSHDRYFLNKMATHVMELTGHKIEWYLGNYDDYKNKKEDLKALHEAAKTATQSDPLPSEPDTRLESEAQESGSDREFYLREKEARKKERKRLRRLEELEKQMAELEAAITQKEEALCDPEIYQDHEKAWEIQTELDRIRETWESCFHEWEQLQEEA